MAAPAGRSVRSDPARGRQLPLLSVDLRGPGGWIARQARLLAAARRRRQKDAAADTNFGESRPMLVTALGPSRPELATTVRAHDLPNETTAEPAGRPMSVMRRSGP